MVRAAAPRWPDPIERVARAPVVRAPDLHIGRIREHHFVHNPFGDDALAILDERSAAWLEQAREGLAGEIAMSLAKGRDDERQRHLETLVRLVDGGFMRSPALDPRNPKSPRERVFNLWLHVTNDCNLACPYCFVAKTRERMDTDTLNGILDTVERTARAGIVDRVNVRFAGGEPMLAFDVVRAFFEECRERVTRHGVALSGTIITNGTIVPGGALEWIARRKIGVSISIDGIGAVHDAMRPMRGGAGSFDAVVRGFETWRGAGIELYGLVTVGRTNLGVMPNLASFFLDARVGFRASLVRDFATGRAELDDRSGAKWGPRGEERTTRPGAPSVVSARTRDDILGVFTEVYDRVERWIERERADGRDVAPSFWRTHRFCDLELRRPMKKACGAGETYLAIGSRGQCAPCHGALSDVGCERVDASRTLVEQATGGRRAPSLARTRGNDACNACAFRASCAGGCPLLLHARDGHADGRSPYCEVFRAVIPRLLELGALEIAPRDPP